MSLREQITKDQINAMKAGEKARLSTIRLLLSAAKYKEVDLKRLLTDEEVVELIGTLIRQRQDSVEQFTLGKRLDLADKESAEIEVLRGYLPPQLSADEVREIVKKCADETGAAGMKDMGKLMKAVQPLTKGKADGKAVADAVKAALGGLEV
ncbi:MAG: GatB/YqeY domain-containing protein [Deltaproteobacteria bacterium]|nr:GatB/YqeY domain-containing protein [Deltaproteobacteria bacterium]